MSYEKHTWETGETITAEKLNNLEQGITNAGILVVNGVYDEQANTVTLDKTWQEIFNAPFAVLRPISEGITPVYIPGEFNNSDAYEVIFINLADEGQYMDFICNTANDYPSATLD